MTHTLFEYKLVDKGGQLIKKDYFYLSNKTCSCGDKKLMPLNTRTRNCSCGMVLAKDANTAPNIRREAIEKLKLNRDGMVQVKARRDAAHSFTACHVVGDASKTYL